MKILSLLAITFLTLTFLSCEKEGPAGPAGPTGNADVTLYQYESRTFTGLTTYTVPISRGKVDSSIVLAYYNPSVEVESAWYPIPGLGSLAQYETRYILFQNAADPANYNFAVRLTGLTGGVYPNAVTFTKTRIFFVPANTFIQGRGNDAVDLNDYYAVCDFLNVAP